MIATKTSRKGSATVTTPSDTEILIERQFDAPARKVFKAYTTPEYVKRWWGFESSEWVECTIDLREGGTYRFVTRDQHEGQPFEVGFHGTYREIQAPVRIVHTEVYEGLPDPDPDASAAIDTVDFLEQDGVTTMRVHVLMPSKEHRDGLLASGMETGMQIGYDRMELLFAEID
jgi:uncharacterized protein YndB with AHSA1/START domain